MKNSNGNLKQQPRTKTWNTSTIKMLKYLSRKY